MLEIIFLPILDQYGKSHKSHIILRLQYKIMFYKSLGRSWIFSNLHKEP